MIVLREDADLNSEFMSEKLHLKMQFPWIHLQFCMVKRRIFVMFPLNEHNEDKAKFA